jgi:altronate hydrolase
MARWKTVIDTGMVDLSQKRILGPVIRLDPRDNVVVARTEVSEGTAVGPENFTTRGQVPPGYKIAARDIRQGEPILKYNTVIGFATCDIPAGTPMHTHNIEFRPFEREYAHARDYQPVAMLPEEQRATFQGIVRDDGRVGTRNYIAVVSIR